MTATPTDRSRWVALVVLCAGMLMIILDQTIVNVALPTIQSDLGFSQSSLAWVVNAYLIALGGLLLLAGRMGDLLGRKRVFLAGLALFTLASLLCGASQTEEMLIGARFVQGIGAAMTSAVILGMIVTMFPQPREQAMAIGIYSFVASAGASIGLLAGGLITQAINWHWIFFVNLPIGVAAAVLAMRLLETDARDRPGRGRRRRGGRPGDGRAHARRLHDRRDRRPRLGLGAHARLRRRGDRAARGLRRAPGDREPAARAAAHLPLAQRLGRERRAGAHGGRHVRDVLHRHAVPAARAGLRRRADRRRLPARVRGHRRAVARLLRRG